MNMIIRSVVLVLLAGALVLGETQPDLNNNNPWVVLTPKMTSANTPDTGKVISRSTPSHNKNVGWKAFDRKKYNSVPMYCPARDTQEDGCKPLPIKFKFNDRKVMIRNYSLYVSKHIPAEHKPINWRLYVTMPGTGGIEILLDNVENFDWSHTEVYTSKPIYLIPGTKFSLYMENPVAADGSMTVTISELELRGREHDYRGKHRSKDVLAELNEEANAE